MRNPAQRLGFRPLPLYKLHGRLLATPSHPRPQFSLPPCSSRKVAGSLARSPPNAMVVRRAVLQAVLCTLALCAAGIGPSSEGCWKHVRRVTEYGAMGAGRTLNTAVFARAVADLARCAGDGGAAQVVPTGHWLTRTFNLTSHFTLFLYRDAEILA